MDPWGTPALTELDSLVKTSNWIKILKNKYVSTVESVVFKLLGDPWLTTLCPDVVPRKDNI